MEHVEFLSVLNFLKNTVTVTSEKALQEFYSIFSNKKNGSLLLHNIYNLRAGITQDPPDFPDWHSTFRLLEVDTLMACFQNSNCWWGGFYVLKGEIKILFRSGSWVQYELRFYPRGKENTWIIGARTPSIKYNVLYCLQSCFFQFFSAVL